MSILLDVQSLRKSYRRPSQEIPVLKDIRLQLLEGEGLAITGSSGVGKSTLLHCLGLLDAFDGGSFFLKGQDVNMLTEKQKLNLRQEKIGFVFQFHYLMSELSAVENVALPLMIAGMNHSESQKKAAKTLAEVGLEERLSHKPSELSGGEQQRVAIARALVHEPSLIIADEPTGNLDAETEAKVFEVLLSRARNLGAGVIMATHNLELAAALNRQMRMQDGSLVVS